MFSWRLERFRERVALHTMRFRAPLARLRLRQAAPKATMLAVGDIAAYHRGPGNAADPDLAAVDEILGASDLRVGNLEMVLTSLETPLASIGAGIRGLPAVESALLAGRLDAVTMANNHCLDYGAQGLLDTCKALGRVGIAHCGSGATIQEARRPVRLDVRGLRVGMLGYCDNCHPAVGCTGPTPAQVGDEAIEEDLGCWRPHVDLLVVHLHWGWEFVMHPPLTYRNRARRLAELGAHVVLCHHAHVPMGVEFWGKSVIAHGLGNFVFGGREGHESPHPWTQRSFALRVGFDEQGPVEAECIPVTLSGPNTVRPASGSEAAEMLGALRVLSARLDDDSWLRQIERDRAIKGAVEALQACARVAPGDGETARQRAMWVATPLRARLPGWLRAEAGATGAEVAGFLEELAQAASDPQRALALTQLCRTERFRRIGLELAAHAPHPHYDLGRVP